MKNCVITGGARGLGLDMAKRFIREGYRVIVLDIETCPLTEADFIKTDLSKPESIRVAFAMMKKKYKKLHVLINNGAISVFVKPMNEVTLEEYDQVSNTNQRGAFICAQEFLSLNKGEAYGRIINIASTRYHQNMEDWELYGMSKGAMVSLTNSLCVSLRGTPVTVNVISPGHIETGAWKELEQRDHDIHPSNRVGIPRDISNVCIFLADEENDFVNGANIIVDGGMTKRMIY